MKVGVHVSSGNWNAIGNSYDKAQAWTWNSWIWGLHFVFFSYLFVHPLLQLIIVKFVYSCVVCHVTCRFKPKVDQVFLCCLCMLCICLPYLIPPCFFCQSPRILSSSLVKKKNGDHERKRYFQKIWVFLRQSP